MMNIYFADEIRKADQKANEQGLTVFALMENSGHALYTEIIQMIKPNDSIGILAGPGNNGGDGIVLARLLKNHGYDATLIFPLGLPKTQIAQQHLSYYVAEGYSYTETIAHEYDVLIDALFGIGFKPPLVSKAEKILNLWNTSKAIKVAIDIPSGVEADTGKVERAFKADYTFCLHGYKPSAFLAPSSYYYGTVQALDIGLRQKASWRIWKEEDVKRTWPAVPYHSHKGTFGTGLLIAGSREMPGCAMMAGKGAMRAGIGKLTIATDPEVAAICCHSLPEATYWYDSLSGLEDSRQLENYRAVAIGPGLTPDERLESLIQALLNHSSIPLILDAGALSQRHYPLDRTAPVILTPHPGEMAKITGLSTGYINENRLKVARDYAVMNHVTVVLKGENTVLAFPDGTGYINYTGNRGLAKGGSGDTLLGILLGLVCQKPLDRSAVLNGVFLHGKTAEYWSHNRAPSSMLASDIMDVWPYLLKELELN